MTYESNFNANEIFEQLRKAREDFEEGEIAVKKAREKRDLNIGKLKKITEELYKKNLELVNKLRACEEKYGK